MAIADRVYSFRSTGDLANALAKASDLLGARETDVPVRLWLMQQFELEVARSLDSMDASRPRQSDLIRTLAEAFASAAAKVARDLDAVPRYREYAESTATSEAERRARAARLKGRQKRLGPGDD